MNSAEHFGQSSRVQPNGTGMNINLASLGQMNSAWVNTGPYGEMNETNSREEKEEGFVDFVISMLLSVFDIPHHYHCTLVIFVSSFARHRAEILNQQFAFQSSNSTQSLLTFEKAFSDLFPQITDTMMIMLSYMLILWLVRAMHSVLKFFMVLMLMTAPCYYIPDMVAKGSKIYVTVGSFKLPIFWFTVIAALALTPIFVLLSLIVIYLIQRNIQAQPGRPTVEEFLDSMQLNIQAQPGGPTVEEINNALDAMQLNIQAQPGGTTVEEFSTALDAIQINMQAQPGGSTVEEISNALDHIRRYLQAQAQAQPQSYQ